MFRKLFRKTPLAWLQISRQKARLLVAIAGISFADFLMFFQLGVRDALFDSQVGPYTTLQGDLFLVNKLSDNLQSVKSFSRDNLYQAVGIDGVASVSSLYIGQATWRNPENQTSRQIFVYGINPNRPAFDLPELNQHLDQLKLLNRALFDRASALPLIGDVPTLLKKQNPLSVQANDYEIKIVGLFTLGISFSAEANLITSDSTFLRLFSQRQAHEIDVGIVKVESKASIERVQASLQAILPDNLLVLTLDEFTARELAYWNTGSAIGPTFNLGVAIGFLVGAVVVYQILYTDVSDHLSEYATLKAMGYSDAYFIGVIIQEALVLAALGFVPGFLLSNGLYALFKSATLLPIAMKLSRATTVLMLTIVMCIGAGAIAMRKLQQADPADIF
ncbi:MAG: ABC transporter permease DevC [Brasilonema octagenarum HA4186-MV1]|jgi:putative ABC transport system permease protein|uniref:ABC transporter n=1 Tax=Brasilonema octagenarum UFV-OR1 TaxID=417115 RepID=A0ABX1ME66_9CYAN|nr:ABC transporter permease DevC [Brasilonema octagenarum]MBW4628871.1 ABC transporter permease DevC [Brasilonema octagenarum HA4186-MV1]NMF65683.1 ABC transporter [Brasilonema octagenarum UFV-OR1]